MKLTVILFSVALQIPLSSCKCAGVFSVTTPGVGHPFDTCFDFGNFWFEDSLQYQCIDGIAHQSTYPHRGGCLDSWHDYDYSFDMPEIYTLGRGKEDWIGYCDADTECEFASVTIFYNYGLDHCFPTNASVQWQWGFVVNECTSINSTHSVSTYCTASDFIFETFASTDCSGSAIKEESIRDHPAFADRCAIVEHCPYATTSSSTPTSQPTTELTTSTQSMTTTTSSSLAMSSNASAEGDLFVDIGQRRRNKRRFICDELNAANGTYATTEPNTFVFEVRDAVIAVLCVVNAMLLAALMCTTEDGTKRQRYVKVAAQTDAETDDEKAQLA